MAKTSHELAIEFAVEITELCSKIKGRPEYTKQLIRSASSISANIAEAKYAESNADLFTSSKLHRKKQTKLKLGLVFYVRAVLSTGLLSNPCETSVERLEEC